MKIPKIGKVAMELKRILCVAVCHLYTVLQKGKLLYTDKRNLFCIIGSFLSAAVSYLYFVTNDILNYDSAGIISGYGSSITLGRWFLKVLGDLVWDVWGNFNLAWFNTLLAVVFMTLAAVVTVHLLGIRSPWLALALGAVTLSFPAIAGTMFFSFTSHYYGFAVFLGVLGVYSATRYRIPYLLLGAFLLNLAVGIYQAYYPFFAALMILWLIREAIDEQKDAKVVFFNAVRLFITLVVSYVFYFVAMKICLAKYGAELSAYQGASEIGKISLRALPSQIFTAYKRFLLLPVDDYLNVAMTHFTKLMIALSFLAALLLVLLSLKGKRIRKIVELFGFLLLLPLASNAIEIMVPNGNIYVLMGFGLVSVFYLPIMLLGTVNISRVELRGLCVAAVVGIVLCATLNYGYINNGNFVRRHAANELANNYFVTLNTRIQSTPGYREDLKIVLVGGSFSDRPVGRWEEFQYTYSCVGFDVINEYSRQHFFRRYIGKDLTKLTDEQLAPYLDDLKAIPAYPDDGGILIIDDYVFVKIS